VAITRVPMTIDLHGRIFYATNRGVTAEVAPMSMDLQTAIQEANALVNSPRGMEVGVVVTMHDEEGQVLYGSCAPVFFSVTAGIFRVQNEGFTTVNHPPPYANQNQFLASNTGTPTQFDANLAIPLEFTVTRRTFAFLGRGLSSNIQLNVATLNATGQVSSRAV